MNWYTACLVFEIKNHHHTQASFFEESWVLFAADNITDAILKAKNTGLEKEESFLNNHSDLVSWTFIGSRHVKQIEMDENSVEIVSISKEHPGYTENTTTNNHTAAAMR